MPPCLVTLHAAHAVSAAGAAAAVVYVCRLFAVRASLVGLAL